MLAGPLVLALAVCFALCLAEFGTFHLAGVRTIGTELAVLYELTGSEAAVAAASWPMAIVALAAGLMLWARSRRWAECESSGRIESPSAAWRWIVLAVLIALSLLAPVALLVVNVSSLGPMSQFLTLHLDELLSSALTAGGAAVTVLLIAFAAIKLGQFAGGNQRRGD